MRPVSGFVDGKPWIWNKILKGHDVQWSSLGLNSLLNSKLCSAPMFFRHCHTKQANPSLGGPGPPGLSRSTPAPCLWWSHGAVANPRLLQTDDSHCRWSFFYWRPRKIYYRHKYSTAESRYTASFWFVPISLLFLFTSSHNFDIPSLSKYRQNFLCTEHGDIWRFDKSMNTGSWNWTLEKI